MIDRDVSLRSGGVCVWVEEYLARLCRFDRDLEALVGARVVCEDGEAVVGAVPEQRDFDPVVIAVVELCEGVLDLGRVCDGRNHALAPLRFKTSPRPFRGSNTARLSETFL